MDPHAQTIELLQRCDTEGNAHEFAVIAAQASVDTLFIYGSQYWIDSDDCLVALMDRLTSENNYATDVAQIQLNNACKSNQLGRVAYFFDNYTINNPQNSIKYALDGNFMGPLRIFMRGHKPSKDCIEDIGTTAASKGQIEAVALLDAFMVEHFSAQERTDMCGSFLLQACSYNRTNMIEFLAPKCTKNLLSQYPLERMVRINNIKAVELLIEHGAVFSPKSELLEQSIRRINMMDMTQLIMKHVNIGETKALHHSISSYLSAVTEENSQHHLDMVELLWPHYNIEQVCSDLLHMQKTDEEQWTRNRHAQLQKTVLEGHIVSQGVTGQRKKM